MNKFLDHIKANKNKYNKSILFAHNSGKFDSIILIEQALMNRPDIAILNRGFIELNGRLI